MTGDTPKDKLVAKAGGLASGSPHCQSPAPSPPASPTPGAGCGLGTTKRPGKLRACAAGGLPIRRGLEGSFHSGPRSPRAQPHSRTADTWSPSPLRSPPPPHAGAGSPGGGGRRGEGRSPAPTPHLPQPPRLRSRGPCGASSAALDRVCLGRVSPPRDPAGSSRAGKGAAGSDAGQGRARVSVDACRGECARGEEEKAPQGVWVWVGGVSRSREWQWAGLGWGCGSPSFSAPPCLPAFCGSHGGFSLRARNREPPCLPGESAACVGAPVWRGSGV